MGFLLCHGISLYKTEVFGKGEVAGDQHMRNAVKKRVSKNTGLLGGGASFRRQVPTARMKPPARPRVARGLIEEADALSAELYYDRGNHHEFVSLVKDLARPGEITQSQAFDFEFTHVEKPYESYTGQNVKLR